jgi:hypothetical protein
MSRICTSGAICGLRPSPRPISGAPTPVAAAPSSGSTSGITRRPKGTALRRAFAAELTAHRRRFLCEKLPVNAFRLGLIGRIFPDARFIYTRRNAIDVARSIAWIATTRHWFGVDDAKWRGLSELAETFAPLRGVAARCRTLFHRGCWEWVLGTAFAEEFFGRRAEVAVAIRYETLVAAPLETLAMVLDRWRTIVPGDFFRRTVPPSRAGGAPAPDDDLTRRLLATDRAALFAAR